ncbi:hypothetical protein [Erwinia aphidicola]|uniref:WYL domain-containing protein n=1 Tax=Erwinia aphidicola TaxID=68334 RepID=UPI003016C5C0
MGPILVFVGLIIGAWAVRSICIKNQSSGMKFAKSVFAIWYFLAAGGLGDREPLPAFIMLLLGIAVVVYSNKTYKAQNLESNDVLNDHASALRDFDLSKPKAKRKDPLSENFAKSKSASGLTKIAFYYINASGESSFRDVDVKRFDGQYIEGYCHLSRAFKTFRLDRVEGDVILRDTGEAMDAYDWGSHMEVELIK